MALVRHTAFVSVLWRLCAIRPDCVLISQTSEVPTVQKKYFLSLLSAVLSIGMFDRMRPNPITALSLQQAVPAATVRMDSWALRALMAVTDTVSTTQAIAKSLLPAAKVVPAVQAAAVQQAPRALPMPSSSHAIAMVTANLHIPLLY